MNRIYPHIICFQIISIVCLVSSIYIHIFYLLVFIIYKLKYYSIQDKITLTIIKRKDDLIMINEHLEIEYKILISKDIFKQLLTDFQEQIYCQYTQINYYFTHPLLEKKQYMLRIREKNNQYEMTLKRPYHNHHIETNLMLSFEEAQKFLNHEILNNDIIQILQQEGISPQELKQQFSLTTHRHDIQFSHGTLSLDENHYLGHVDYELEFEVDNENEYQVFLALIHKYQLHYTHNCPSKIKRVLDIL